MIRITQGLVLRTINYSETSVIVKVFTREMGVRSYIVKGVRSAKGRVKQNLLQPLSYLDMAVYDSHKTNINYIKDMSPAEQFSDLKCDSVKVTLVFFMTELLYKTLNEEEPMPEVFDYVVEQLRGIDNGSIKVGNQPLLFMLQMSTYLGIEPLNNYSVGEPLFNLKEGKFVGTKVDDYLLDNNDSLTMHYLLAAYHGTSQVPKVSSSGALHTLIDYYGLHLPEFRNFKSHEILHTILQ